MFYYKIQHTKYKQWFKITKERQRETDSLSTSGTGTQHQVALRATIRRMVSSKADDELQLLVLLVDDRTEDVGGVPDERLMMQQLGQEDPLLQRVVVHHQVL